MKDELTPEDTGIWLVTTVGSKHTFDFEHLTYTRRNVDGLNPIEGDGETVPLDPDLIMIWPKVGDCFLMILRLGDFKPYTVGTIRMSSEVQSIEQIA